ncbi:MAG: hypothetical protein FJ405_14945, partial [Verrucomicrobia bacterium]|nr:hypothetical protein [Verrucomicrobiota bacterium]
MSCSASRLLSGRSPALHKARRGLRFRVLLGVVARGGLSPAGGSTRGAGFAFPRFGSFVALFVLLSCSWLNASLDPSRLPMDLLKKYCFECHDDAGRKGNLSIESLATSQPGADVFARWEKIHDKLSSGEMPPPQAEQPPSAQRNRMITELASELARLSRERQLREGRAPVRRLSLRELENALG